MTTKGDLGEPPPKFHCTTYPLPLLVLASWPHHRAKGMAGAGLVGAMGSFSALRRAGEWCGMEFDQVDEGVQILELEACNVNRR